MIVSVNLYLKMPASTYDGRRFIVVIEPQLSPAMVNARIYGTDYVVVSRRPMGKSPWATCDTLSTTSSIPCCMSGPTPSTASSRYSRKSTMLAHFRFRSDTVWSTIECLIKAIEARTMDTGIPEYKIPAGVDRRSCRDTSMNANFTCNEWTR